MRGSFAVLELANGRRIGGDYLLVFDTMAQPVAFVDVDQASVVPWRQVDQAFRAGGQAAEPAPDPAQPAQPRRHKVRIQTAGQAREELYGLPQAEWEAAVRDLPGKDDGGDLAYRYCCECGACGRWRPSHVAAMDDAQEHLEQQRGARRTPE
jgi:hypothetical protein